MTNNIQICNECGCKVHWGSGNFVDRIPDLNDYETKVDMNKAFPEGEYICRDCDDKYCNRNED